MAKTTHGLTKHPLFRIWDSMKQRCYNKEKDVYFQYGGRGVEVCEQWKDDFKSFYDWALSNGYKKGLQLDKDIKAMEKGVEPLLYSPEFCQFTTAKINSNNRRSSKFLTLNGKTQTISQWADELGVGRHTIQERLRRGWSVEEALSCKRSDEFNKRRYNGSLYDTEQYDFVGLVSNLFGVSDLSKIDDYHSELFKVGDDSKTRYHTLFYDKYRAGWKEMEELYELFIAKVVAPKIKEDFLFQKFPTARVHLKKNVAVGAFHNDAEFGHPEGEINFIIPLTNSDNTASIWVESIPGRKDFSAMKLRIGCLIRFNGNFLTHGNKINETYATRVSLDFRILPISKYKPDAAGQSITKKTKFIEGEYYKRFNK